MTKIEPEEIEKLDEVETLDETDDTIDWKEKAKGLVEKAIQRREKSKIFRQQYKDTMDELAKLKTSNTPPLEKKDNKPDEALLQRMEKIAFKQHDISHEDDIDLARKTAKKWGMDIEDVLGDDDFKVKLEKQQTSRSNVLAASGRGGANHGTNVKNSPDYWLAQGRPPTPEEVPDLNARSEILGALMEAAKKGDGSKFFQDFKPQV